MCVFRSGGLEDLDFLTGELGGLQVSIVDALISYGLLQPLLLLPLSSSLLLLSSPPLFSSSFLLSSPPLFSSCSLVVVWLARIPQGEDSSSQMSLWGEDSSSQVSLWGEDSSSQVSPWGEEEGWD